MVLEVNEGEEEVEGEGRLCMLKCVCACICGINDAEKCAVALRFLCLVAKF